MIKYIAPFFIAFIINVILTAFLIVLGKKIKWRKRQSNRHIHDKKAYRIGGIGMTIAFNLAIVFNRDLVISPELYGLMASTVILMIVGFWDDVKEIYWKFQLFFQTAAAVLIFVMGARIYYVTNPVTGGIFRLDHGLWVVVATAIVIFWIVLVINAINWLDGIDGLSGGVTAISAVTIIFLSLKVDVNQPPIAIVSSILLGTTLGFLVYNFFPSKVLAGTSGSMFMGLALATLAVFSGTKIATALLVLSIPIMDLVWVISERLKTGRSIFKPDKSHLHYRLMELGWSQKKIALCYYLITAVIAVIALNTRAFGKSMVLLLVVFFMAIFSLLIRRKAQLKNK